MSLILWHSFDLNKLISLLLPTFLRRLNMVLFMRALLSPLDTLKGNLLYKMQHDCRVIYMEKVLNEAFSIPGYVPNNHQASKVIYITDGDDPDEEWLNLETSPEPIFLGTVFINRDSFYDINYSDFIVHIPVALQAQEYKIKDLIEYYRMAGKVYKINYF